MAHHSLLNRIIQFFWKIVLNLLHNLQSPPWGIDGAFKTLPPLGFFINLVLSLEVGALGSVRDLAFCVEMSWWNPAIQYLTS